MKLRKTIATACLSMLLISCQNDTQLAEGGITGSGISFGPITSFGSIWVGGVRFDVENAEFIRNGQTDLQGQDSFNVGEIVNIEGSVNEDGVTGIATKVEFDRKLSGLISATSTDGTTFKVLGQQVETDVLTLFTGFDSLTELNLGNVVEISGSRTPEGTWIASTVNLTQTAFVVGESELEVEGRITAVNDVIQTFKVGDLTINYSTSVLNGVADLSQAAGQYIEIQSQQNLENGQLVASKIEPEDEYPQFENGSYTKMDGRITDFSNTQVFDVNGQATILTESTVLVDGGKSDLGLGAHIGLEGMINDNGILEAAKITIRQSADTNSATNLEARIESIDSITNELVVLGTTVTINSSTIILDYSQGQAESIQFEKLFTNDLIRIAGRKLSNGKILALRIDRNPPKTDTDEDHSHDSGDENNDQSDTNQDTSEDESGTDANQDTPEDESNTDDANQENDGREIIRLKGKAKNIDASNRTFMVNDTNILTDADTLYINTAQVTNPLEQETFFNSERAVVVEGYSLGNGWIQAVKIQF